MTRTDRLLSRVAFTLALMLALAGLLGAVRASTVPAFAEDTPTEAVSAPAPEAPAGGDSAAVVPSSEATDGTTETPDTSAAGGSVADIGGTEAGGGATSEPPGSDTPDPSSTGDDATSSEGSTGSEPATDGSTSETPAEGGGETSTDPEDGTEPDTGGTTPETPDSPEGDDGSSEPGEGNGTEDGGESDEGDTGEEKPVAPASIIVDPDSPDGEPGTTPVTITVTSYLCESDPGGSPQGAAGCVPAAGLYYQATDSSGDRGTIATNAEGIATFTSTVGSAFVVEQQTLETGYVVWGDGEYEILSLDGDTTLTFVNVKKETLGTLQLSTRLCMSTSRSGTEFSVPVQSRFTAAAEEESTCAPNSGAVFTLTSSALPGGSMTVRMDDLGDWAGYVPAGAYVVTAPDGVSSGEVSVGVDGGAVVLAAVWIQQQQGTLALELFRCQVNPERIQVNPVGPAYRSCSAAGGVITVTDEEAEISEAITLGPDGVWSLLLKPGNYLVVGPGGAAASVSVVAGQTSLARVLAIAPPDGDGTGNPQPGGGSGDGTGGIGNGGRPIAGDGTGVDGAGHGYGSNSALNVTQLPNTGAGGGTSDYWWPMLLLALAGGLAIGGYRLRPQVARGKR